MKKKKGQCDKEETENETKKEARMTEEDGEDTCEVKQREEQSAA